MLYYLFDYLDREFNLIGAGVFQYISFRAGMAAFLSLLITITFGENLINILRRKQVGEDIRLLNGVIERVMRVLSQRPKTLGEIGTTGQRDGSSLLNRKSRLKVERLRKPKRAPTSEDSEVPVQPGPIEGKRVRDEHGIVAAGGFVNP